ncbi:MAG TPA: apolipoprotein N-acyltransferase [Acidimicrobiales bacterium]|nr:apolipoprotein N-acyltransferase [Acidimicrobiales bacterium]
MKTSDGAHLTVRGRLWRLALPSLVAGVAIALSLPPWGWWPLALVGSALLYWRLRGLRPGGRLLAGWLAGLGCYVPGLWWARSFNWYGAAVLMAVEALFMGVAAVLVPPRRGRLLAYPAAFTLLEALRMAWPFGGLPIGGAFLGQAGGPLLGTARIGGPLLVTALVWLAGAALAELALRWSPPRPIVAPVAAGLVVVVLSVLAVGAPDGGPVTRWVRVAAVQGGGRRGTSAEEVDGAAVYSAELAATATVTHAGSGRRPSLVVWPEDVISLGRPLAGSPEAATLAGLARQLRATVLAGVTEPAPGNAFSNLMVAWGPRGRVVGTYQKVHRVPFGEYVPYRSFFAHFASLAGVPLTAVPGHGDGLLRTPVGPLGVMVSYEVFFADRGRAPVAAGARLLVVPTNTSSYSATQVPAQEVAADRVQAVAEGRTLVQAAPTGYSTFVTPAGAVTQRSVLGRRQVLVGSVALRSGRTLYALTGDLPVLVVAGAALVAGWVVSGRRRGREGDGEASDGEGTGPEGVPGAKELAGQEAAAPVG